MMRKALIKATAGFFLWTVLAVTFPGTAAATAVTEIWTLEQLQHIGDNATTLGSYYKLMTDIDASETSTWNSGAGFVPIGTSGTPFNGGFDGDGHVIRNLYINRPGTDNVGLFGYVQGSITNLGLEQATVTGSNSVGGLAGYANSGYIVSCYTTGSVNGAGDRTGGLIGKSTYCTIYACYSTAAATGSGDVGGLVGAGQGDDISVCYSTGAVSGSSGTGGFAGANLGSTINCFWDNETSGQATSAGGTSKTTAAMKTKSTFTDAGWDFAGTWCMIEGVTYPHLQWRADTIALQEDSYSATGGSTLDVPAPGVLANDNDSGVAPSAVVAEGPVHGTLSLSADGSFTYTPDTGYAGEDSFIYTTDSGCDNATVTITVTEAPPTTTTTTVPTTTTTVPASCTVEIRPRAMGWFLGEREKTRYVLAIGERGTVFEKGVEVTWDTEAIETLKSFVLFRRFVLVKVRIDGAALSEGGYGVTVGDCTGELTVKRR